MLLRLNVSFRMKIPEIVVFDLGKVLVDFDYNIAAQKISQRGRITPQDIQKLVDHSPLLYRFETGLMSNEEFFSEVCAATGFGGEFGDGASELGH